MVQLKFTLNINYRDSQKRVGLSKYFGVLAPKLYSLSILFKNFTALTCAKTHEIPAFGDTC